MARQLLQNNIFFEGNIPSSDDLVPYEMLYALTQMIDGKVAADTMHLFTNTTGSVITYDHYDVNEDLWCAPLRPQLTGVHMGMQQWGQGYSFQPLTRRHVHSCAHNGDSRVGIVVTWIHPDGATVEDMLAADDTKVCKRTIIAQINDYPNAFCSDPQEVLEADLMICKLGGDPLPDWVAIPDVLVTTVAQQQAIGALGVPGIVISQGNPVAQYTGEFQVCPHNRKAYLTGLVGSGFAGYSKASVFADFRHDVTTGDSGTNQRLLVNDTLYLHATGGVVLADYLDYLHSMISRSDIFTGDITNLTISTKQFN